jgi:hypothetical protein
MLKGTWKLWISASIFLIVINFKVTAQTHQDSVMARQVALTADFVNKIKAAGLTPSLSVPKIILDNPRSFGNYDDSLNVLHTCDWATLPPSGRAVFEGFAAHMGNGMTAEKFFNVAVYQWIFIHELGHWWRACQHVIAEPYENEKAANRIASSYWNDKDPAFYKFMLSVFQGVVDHSPSPVPAGQEKAKYLDDNYQKLPGGSAYTWYQAIMIVEVGKEKPFETFKQAVVLAGKPLK